MERFQEAENALRETAVLKLARREDSLHTGIRTMILGDRLFRAPLIIVAWDEPFSSEKLWRDAVAVTISLPFRNCETGGVDCTYARILSARQAERVYIRAGVKEFTRCA